MQVTELLKLTQWFKTNVAQAEVHTLYANLYNAMYSNLSDRYSQPSPLENYKNELFKAIKDVNFQSLSLEQIKYLDTLKVVDLLGQKGINEIENILFKNQLDLNTATQKIKSIADIMQEAVTTINDLSTILQKSFELENNDDDKINNDEILIRVYFKDNAAINNLTNFKEYGSIWYEVGRGISMAQDKTPEDFKIIGAEKGSVILGV
ncbi:MAG: hypothetical protein FWD60_08365 [Candidatus Azobacteroides sp.]|nr:hypothetical protein [Candidatus Azobacteroides sp.]